ncbi:MAG: hypothetical protein NT004_06175, partial [Bacteroidetes bacterium]|nr:hypothetical protein [Bacteroidota bacterium]
NSSMHGHLLSQSLGGTWDKIKFIFGLVQSSINEEIAEQEAADLAEVNVRLNKLCMQDSILKADIASLANEMNYNTTEILNQINNSVANSAISDVMTAMNSGDQMGLRWYSQAWANFYNNVPGYDSSYMKNYVSHASAAFQHYHSINQNLPNDFNTLQLLMVPALTGDSGCMYTFSKMLVGQFATQGASTTSNSLMNTYLFLEFYYLTLVTYQLQAATAHMNVVCATDTLMGKAYWENDVVPAMVQGAGAFLNSVDYLLMNLFEYRDMTHWYSDMAFAGLWMAPNSDMNNIQARARFQTQVLYQILGVTKQVIYGTIITPAGFCASPPRVNVGTTPYTLPASTSIVKSRIPYTSWSGVNCSPGNRWTLYHYSMGNGMNCQPWNINVIPTWSHLSSGNGYGTITPLWFNPRNPTLYSSVKTDSCTIQFAFFSLIWPWGIMMSDYVNTSNAVLNLVPCPFNSCGCDPTHTPPVVPLVATIGGDGVDFSSVQYDAQRAFGNNSLQKSNPFSYTLTETVQEVASSKKCLTDLITVPLNITDTLPGGDVEMWANFSANYQANPTGNASGLKFQIGTTTVSNENNVNGHPFTPPCNSSSADLTNGGFGSTVSGFAYHQAAKNDCKPCFQYSFMFDNSASPTPFNNYISVNVNITAQIVFRGYFGQ